MALIRPSQYPGRWNAVSGDAPQGSGKNRTSPTSNDGSYFDQVWFNDLDSLHQALFIASGVSPDGTQDVGTASQIFDALINNRWSPIGNYSVGTVVTGSDGNQYKCVSANGRDSSVVDPASKTDRTVWTQFPYEKVVNSNGTAYIYADGRMVQFGVSSTTTSSGLGTVTFPVPFTSAPVSVQISENSAQGWGVPPKATTYGTDTAPTTTQMTVRGVRNDDTSQAGESGLSFRWVAEI